MSALISGRIGADYRVDMEALVQRLVEIDDGRVISSRASHVIARLRLVVADIESELLALGEDCERPSQFEHGESELFEGSVSEVRELSVVHHANGRVGVVRRVLSMLLHRAGHLVSGAHGSPSIDAHGPESRGASESIVGVASGVAPSTTPDASSEEMGS